MNTYIALFRGINVGGRNLLPMKDLVRLMEENNYQNVKSYIQSGNLIFQSDKEPDVEIAVQIKKHYGFKPEILFLSAQAFYLAAKNSPFQLVEGKTAHFYFCKNTPKVNLTKLEGLIAESEQYSINGNVLYLHAPQGIGRSKLVANIEGCLGVSATGRNLNTVNKLLTLLDNIVLDNM